MKYILLFVGAFVVSLQIRAQPAQRHLVKEDTITLNPALCAWVLPGSVSNKKENGDSAQKSIPFVLLDLAYRGKITLYDAVSGQSVPAREVYTWQIPADTVSVQNPKDKNRFRILQQELHPEFITRIRINLGWYLQSADGSLSAEIKWVELIREIHASEGTIIGYRPAYRILYGNSGSH